MKKAQRPLPIAWTFGFLVAALPTAALRAADSQVSPSHATAARPNVLIIVADDLGYADVGFNGCKDIPTPNVDALARRSVRCANGYVSHPFCSPTRAGLMTGRYQQHFGHENNPVWNPADEKSGLPLSETTLPQVLQESGYTTGWVGKWHLGAHPSFHPMQRWFEETFGLLGGGHQYLEKAVAKRSSEYTIPLDRNGSQEPQKGHLTRQIADEGASFITRHAGDTKPWFLYAAFNAPHTPLEPDPQDLASVDDIHDATRRQYAGLVVGMDRGVGTLIESLAQTKQENKTIVWFFSDNGGPVSVTHSDNHPLRAAKGSVYDGGIHVPFLVAWPGTLPEGKVFAPPVISLDVFATAAAVSGATVPPTHKLDGVNLLPFLQKAGETSEGGGQNPQQPHDALYWRTSNGTWAIRAGDWKLVSAGEAPKPQLFNLKDDVSEKHDLANDQPERASELKAKWDAWNKLNIPPVFSGPNTDARKKKAKAGE